MPTTSKGLPYPDSSSHNRLWEHFQSLAEAVDTLLTPASWQSWTPVLGASTTTPTMGTGSTATGRYRISGKVVEFDFTLVLGTGATAGAGFYFVTVPVPPAGASIGVTLTTILGYDASSGRYVHAVGTIGAGGTTVNRIRFGDDGLSTTASSFTESVPWAWAVGDQMYGSGRYEID